MKSPLIDAVNEASRENSMATVFFHSAVAERADLGPTDHKALDLIVRHGSLTAGELSSRTGLTAASVTSLIDRLEARGFVRRKQDAKDRRRVIVEPVWEGLSELTALFDDLQSAMNELLAQYTDEQLETIRDYLVRSSERLREATEWLREGTN